MAYIHPVNAPALYVDTTQSRLVAEDSPDAAYVLVGPGGTLSDALASRYGLSNVSRETTEKQGTGPTENKVKRPPKSNKKDD